MKKLTLLRKEQLTILIYLFRTKIIELTLNRKKLQDKFKIEFVGGSMQLTVICERLVKRVKC